MYAVKSDDATASTGPYNTNTPCGLAKYASDKGKTPITTTTSGTMSVTGLSPDTSYEINVVALCDSTCNYGGSYRTAAYHSIDIHTPSTGGGGISIFIIIGAVAVLIPIVVAAFLLFRRTKKLKAKLDYEMKDVRNIARVHEEEGGVDGAKHGRGANAYSSLLNEDVSPIVSPARSPTKEQKDALLPPV